LAAPAARGRSIQWKDDRPTADTTGSFRIDAIMPTRALLAAVILLAFACVGVAADSGPAADINAIRELVQRYLEAVDTVDLSLLSQIWSHSSEASFIYPLGEEHGFDAIEQHVFENVMGGMFSARDLQARGVTVHVNRKAAWSEFQWTFHATTRKDGSAVTTKGVETQIYRKEGGRWRLVHVHYSEDRQSTP
jgi:ketosteroid isomerase-like protein